MHYHLEIVIPPMDDIPAAVASIMEPFNENREDDEDHDQRHTFWDWYVIGGRFAGDKLLQKYDPDKIQAFYDWLRAEHVTCSGLQWGKHELSPASQIPKVDAKWNEMFPRDDGTIKACPIFQHSNDAYGHNGLDDTLDGDIARLADSLHAKCHRVIFAGPSYDADNREYTGPLEAKFMIAEEEWNGVTHVKSAWDGSLSQALEMARDKYSFYRDDYAATVTPADDWLVVTVDYHD